MGLGVGGDSTAWVRCTFIETVEAAETAGRTLKRAWMGQACSACA